MDSRNNPVLLCFLRKKNEKKAAARVDLIIKDTRKHHRPIALLCRFSQVPLSKYSFEKPCSGS